MANKKTTIGVTLRDHVNQTGTMSFSFDRGWLAALADFFGWTASKSDALKDFVESYSYAKCVRSGINNAMEYSMPTNFLKSAPMKGFDTIDQKAVITLRDTTSGAPHTISIPAPKADIFEPELGQGQRVEPISGAAIAADFSTILGRTMVFEQGWLIGKK